MEIYQMGNNFCEIRNWFTYLSEVPNNACLIALTVAFALSFIEVVLDFSIPSLKSSLSLVWYPKIWYTTPICIQIFTFE